MAKYKKCPRCRLNYILETEELCKICIDEISGKNQYNSYCKFCGVILNDNEDEICDSCLENLHELIINDTN